MKKILLILLSLLLILSLAGCQTDDTSSATPSEEGTQSDQGDADDTDSPIIVGQTWMAGSLDPVGGSASWALTSHGIAEYVYMQDENGNLNSRFIKELNQVDDLNWDAVMNEDVKFSDGSDVNSEAFCESMNIIMEENELSNATAGKMEFTPTGDYTFSIKTERPTKVMESVFAEWTNVIFKRSDDNSYIFTGPYVVKSFEQGTELALTPNTYYPNAENRSDILLKNFEDVSAMKLAMESGEIDMAFTVTPEVAQMLKDADVTIQSIEAGYQYFAPLNLNGVLQDANLRKAINLGLNREDYQTALLGGELPTGLFAHYYSFAGTDPVTYDLDEANKILDEAGYELQDGLRYRDGEQLKLKIITYGYRPDLPVLMQIMVTQLADLGIEAETAVVENIDAELKEGNFDIALYAQHTAPTGNPAFFLNQFLRTDGSKNHMGYSSAEFDALLDEMALLPLGDEMYAKAQEAQHMVSEDLPVLYLLDPKWHVAISDRLEGYMPYCGDYFIINDQLLAK